MSSHKLSRTALRRAGEGKRGRPDEDSDIAARMEARLRRLHFRVVALPISRPAREGEDPKQDDRNKRHHREKRDPERYAGAREESNEWHYYEQLQDNVRCEPKGQ
jgi:hypothetical protein